MAGGISYQDGFVHSLSTDLLVELKEGRLSVAGGHSSDSVDHIHQDVGAVNRKPAFLGGGYDSLVHQLVQPSGVGFFEVLRVEGARSIGANAFHHDGLQVF